MSDREQDAFVSWLAGDWTVPLDDLLTQRWQASSCTTCSQKPVAWHEIRALPCGLAVAVVLCDRCHVGDRDRMRLDKVLQTRYGNGNERP